MQLNLQGGRHTIFIYCDLAQNENLGDFQAALPRVIPLRQNVASSIQWSNLLQNFRQDAMEATEKEQFSINHKQPL